MKIRKCREKDLQEIQEIEEKSFEHPYSEETFQLFQNSDYFLVAEIKEDQLGGYIIGEERQEYSLIVSLAVRPSHRRKGIGSSLIQELRKKMNNNRFLLVVRKSNNVAQRFYQSMGFSEKGIIEDYYQNDEDGIVMESSYPNSH